MKAKFHVAVFGIDRDKVSPELVSLATGTSFLRYDGDDFMEPIEPAPEVILCYPPVDGLTTLEIAQTLRMNYPEGNIFFITYEKKNFDKKKLVKNGFTQAYLLPWEMKDLISAMKTEALYSTLPELRNYTAVKILDLIPGSILDFPLKAYLPLNNKLIPFSAEGCPITEEKMIKLEENSLNTLFVPNEDIKKFREYTARTLKKLMKPGAISETERHEKLKTCVRDLISDIFIEDNEENTFSKSQGLLKEVKEVIHLLIDDKTVDHLKKINAIVNQESSFYQHLSNVSAYAGIFALMLGYENPEQMALAGILHDIGKVNLPIELADLPEEKLTPAGLKAYQNHPNYSMDVIKLKRIPLPDKVINAILQHHEAMNGTGYPNGLEGHRISFEGRLLAIANLFDKYTTLVPGQKVCTPKEALTKMYQENTGDPGKTKLDVEMLKKLIDFVSRG